MNSGNGNISFGSTVNGANALTINAGSGTVGFTGNVGNTNALSSLTLTNSGALTFSGSLNVANALTQTNAATGLTSFSGVSSVGSASLSGTSYKFANSFSTTAGNFNMTNSGTATVASSAPISVTGGNFIANASGVGALSLVSNITALTATNTIAINEPVTLASGAGITLTTNNGNVTVGGTVAGTSGTASSLTITTGTGPGPFPGTVTLNKIYGSGTSADPNGLTTVAINNAGNTNFNDVIAISGSLSETVTGATIFANTVNVGSANLTGTSFDINNGFTTTAGALSFTNSQTMTLSSANPISVTGGDFSVSGASVLGNDVSAPNAMFGGNITLSSPTVSLTAYTGGITAAPGVSGAGKNLVVSNIGANSSIGPISNIASLTKLGIGTLTLTSANSYTGPTTISAGTLNILNAGSLGTGAATVATNAVLKVTGNTMSIGNTINLSNGSTVLDNNTNTSSATANNFTGSIVIADNGMGTFNVGDVSNSSDILTIGGVISGNNITLNKTGVGTLALAGTNTYSGTTQITTGGLSIQATNALGGAGANAIVNAGGSLVLAAPNISLANTFTMTGGTITDTNTNSTTTLNGLITVAGGSSSTFAIANSTSTMSILGGISGSGITVNKIGNGTLYLPTANAYTGNTFVTAGTIKVANSSSLGTSGTATIDGSVLGSNSTLQLVGTSLNLPTTINLTNATIVENNKSASNILNNVVLSGVDTINVANVTSDALTIAGTVSGNATLTKSGVGTLFLSGANPSFSGTTNINAGVMNVQNSLSLGTTAVNLASSGSLFLSLAVKTNPSVVLANNLTLATGATILDNASGKADALTGTITVASGGTVNINVVNPLNDTFSITGAISGTGITINKLGVGALQLGGNNSFTGTLNATIGNVIVTSNNALGTGTFVLGSATKTASLILSGTGLNIANNITMNTGSSIIEANNGGANTLSGTITVNGIGNIGVNTFSNDTLTLAGANSGIVGTGITLNLNNGGVGTLIINPTNNNTYTGTTNIGGGVVKLTNNATVFGAAGNTVNVNSGATLNLFGTLNANVAAGINLNLNGATILSSGTNTISATTLALTGANTITANGTLLDISTAITGLGSLAMNGTGVLKLDGANGYNGGTTLTSGTLRANMLAHLQRRIQFQWRHIDSLVALNLASVTVGECQYHYQ